MVKHTPVPWKVEWHGSDSAYIGNIVRTWSEGDCNYVTTISCQLKWGGDALARANAKFIVEAVNSRATLLSQNAKLREALQKYGTHHANCQMGSPSLPAKCTCGFDAALAEPEL